MSWRISILHYDEGKSQPNEEKVFEFETEAECIAAQKILKYITKWNGGDPVVSSNYWEADTLNRRRK